MTNQLLCDRMMAITVMAAGAMVGIIMVVCRNILSNAIRKRKNRRYIRCNRSCTFDRGSLFFMVPNYKVLIYENTWVFDVFGMQKGGQLPCEEKNIKILLINDYFSGVDTPDPEVVDIVQSSICQICRREPERT